jgi:hypothetical protein
VTILPQWVSPWRPIALIALAMMIVGCSGDRRRYPLTGMVTYAGQPVPYGEIMFAPNARAGNAGPGTVTEIRKGRYQTPPTLGVIGGKYLLEVSGFDKPGDDGVEIFPPWSVEADLPEYGGEFNLEVPTVVPTRRPGR